MAEKKRTAEEIVANLKRARQEPQSEVIALPATAVAPEWPVMDPAAYYGFAREVVKTIGPHSEADPNAILLQLSPPLAILSAAPLIIRSRAIDITQTCSPYWSEQPRKLVRERRWAG